MTSLVYGEDDPTVRPKAPGQKGGYGSLITPSGMAKPASYTALGSKGTGFQPFGAGNNLVGTQINPTPSKAATTAQGYTQNAQQQYAGLPWFSTGGNLPTAGTVNPYDQSKSQSLLDLAEGWLRNSSGGGGGGQGFGFSGDTGTARGITLSELQKLTSATPDRGKLAADTYELLLERGQPKHDANIRALGQRTAALGRAGSGLYNTELADIETDYRRGLDQSRRQLATESAGLTLQDAIDRIGAARGVTDTLGGLDISAGGLNLAAANSGRAADAQRFNQALELFGANRTLGLDRQGFDINERDTALTNDWRRYGAGQDVADRNFDLARSRFGDFAGYEGQQMGEDRARRDEYRGERDYQYGLSRDAQGDRERAQAAQQDWLDRLFDRGATLTDYGYRGSPAGVYGAQADRYGQQAGQAFDVWGPLLEMYGLNRRRGTQTGNGSANPPDAMGY